jgi:hypothetical protein
VIARRELGDRISDVSPEVLFTAVRWRRNHKRPVLGPYRVIGGNNTRLAVTCDLGAANVIEDFRIGAKIEHEAAIRAGDLGVRLAACSAYNWCHPRNRTDPLGQLRGCKHTSATPKQVCLGQRHHFDHALVSLARARPERENAVLVKD